MRQTENRSRFAREYCSLVERFRSRAESEGTVCLPMIPPTGKVDYVFVGMEPSFGHWARTPQQAEDKIGRGFKDYAFSVGDFILHHCIREYLCREDRSLYYITDLSKGAMTVKRAARHRLCRYKQWLDLLEKELALVSKETTAVIAIGKYVRAFLVSNGFVNIHAILHYSQQAARYRNKWMQWDETAFDSFKRQVSSKDIVATARSVTRQAEMDWDLTSPSLRRLENHDLTTSQKMLMFSYKCYFTRLLLGSTGECSQ